MHQRVVCTGVLGAAIAAPLGTPANAQDSGPEEIIVTSRYREENLQQTPLAITAITGDALDLRSLLSPAHRPLQVTRDELLVQHLRRGPQGHERPLSAALLDRELARSGANAPAKPRPLR